jgi:hypothetical protein
MTNRGARQPWYWGDEVYPSPAYLLLEHVRSEGRKATDEERAWFAALTSGPQSSVVSYQEQEAGHHDTPNQRSRTGDGQ